MTHALRPIIAALLGLALLLPDSAPGAEPQHAAQMLEDRLSALEAEIGGLMQRRDDEASARPRELELRIDVRIVARWLAACAAEAPPGSDLQAAGWIRAHDLQSAAMLVERELDTGRVSPGPGAPLAFKKLHDLTFKLPEAKSVANLDDVCRTAGTALLAASGGDAAVARLPEMRPPPRPAAGSAAASAEASPAPIDQLAARAREVAVSHPLRDQLLAVSRFALEAGKDAKRKDELAASQLVLDQSVRLAEGLQTNTAVEREDRVRMEAQVAQGLAMFLDTRTRALGQRRVSGLAHYADMLARLRAMNLSADLQRRFAAALNWARANPEPGSQVVASIETFARQDARLSGIPARRDDVNGVYAKAADEAKRRAIEARDSFVAAAASESFYRRPDTLKARGDAFRSALDAHDTLARTPATLKAVNAYRPKPFGGIDKRVQSAVGVWTGESTEAERGEAVRFLAQLNRLADSAAESNAATTAPAADDATVRAYAGDNFDALLARRKAIVADVINATAAGAPLNDAAFAPLETARALLNVLGAAARAERAVAEADVLRRWVDWGVDGEDLAALLAPMRESTAEAFAGFADNDTSPVKTWAESRKRYDPVLALLGRVAARAEDCQALPPGRTGALAKLLTPLADEPYAAERAARFAIDAWAYHHAAKRRKAADAALDALAARLPR